jgi:hypothetical protein
MVKRAKLVNTGNENEDEVGGFAPGVAEAIAEASAAEVAHESNDDVETAQDAADQEAAGVNMSDKDIEKARKAGMRALQADVVQAGADYGAGHTSMIRLAEVVTEAAMKDIISPEHADELYDKFRAAADKKATMDDVGIVPDEATMDRPPVQDGEDKSRSAQLSKLRAFIKLGNKFVDDGSDIIRRARNIHVGLLRGDRKTLKAGSTHVWLYAIAVAQLKHATSTKTMHVLTDDEMRALMTQAAKDPTVKEGADKLLDAIIAAKAARNGSAERAPVPSDELDAAIDLLQQALAAVDPDKLNDYEAKLADAETKKVEAEAKRAEATAVKAARALAPKGTKKGPPRQKAA